MIRILSALPVTALIAATPLSVAAQTTPAQEAVIRAFLQFDCVMTLETQDAVVAAIGLPEDEAEAVGLEMLGAGQLQETEQGMVLLHPDCPNGGSAPQPAGAPAAIAWMGALTTDQAANVVAEMIAARGCTIGADEYGRFEGEVGAAIARRFGFDETALPSEEMDPFLDALDAMGERGGLQLIRQGRVEDGPDGAVLVDCAATAPGDAEVPVTEAELSERLAALEREDITAIENAALAEIGCRVPEMMGYNFSALVLDRVLASVNYDLGPAGALAVMGPAWIAFYYDGPDREALTYASGLVNDTVHGMIRDGRLEREGRILVATNCEPGPDHGPMVILPYLTAGQ